MLVNNGGVSTDSMLKGSSSADVFHDALTLHVTSAPPLPHPSWLAQPVACIAIMACTPRPVCAPAAGRGGPLCMPVGQL